MFRKLFKIIIAKGKKKNHKSQQCQTKTLCKLYQVQLWPKEAGNITERGEFRSEGHSTLLNEVKYLILELELLLICRFGES